MNKKSLKKETTVVHSGMGENQPFGALAPPIFMTTSYRRAPDGKFPHGYYYSIFGNPNRQSLETSFCEIEGGKIAAAFSSGSAATAAVFSILNPGDHVLCPLDVFQGTARILKEIFSRYDLRASFVDMTNEKEIEQGITTSTRLIWIETPSNPLFRITDVEAVCALARRKGILTAIDNTLSTPVLYNPLRDGVDFVVHASTKYLSGHGDALGGVVISLREDENWQRIVNFQQYLGVAQSPFEAWLVRRGISTLAVRVKTHAENALKIAEFLEKNPMVENVFYPGLPTHPGFEIAKKQMRNGFGGMLSFTITGNQESARKVAGQTKIFKNATSFGCPESLIEHRLSSPIQTRGKGSESTIPDNLIRLSVGLENSDDLISDLCQALSRVLA